MKTFKKILLFIHQLPQNLLGLLVIFFTVAHKEDREFEYVAYLSSPFGVSLGNFIIFGKEPGSETSYKHEYGHHIQSIKLGWLYLFVVGLPSILGNIWDRIAHGSWTYTQREVWYYSRFPERWADKLGNVKRF